MSTEAERQVVTSRDVAAFLARLKKTVPYPCNADGSYLLCFPKQVAECMKHYAYYGPATMKKFPQMHNALSLFDNGLVDVRALVRLAPGNNLPERLFYLKMGKHYPAPSVSGGVVMPPSHPHFEAVWDWHCKASEVEQEIMDTTALVSDISKEVGWPNLLDVWPRLKIVGAVTTSEKLMKYRNMPRDPARIARAKDFYAEAIDKAQAVLAKAELVGETDTKEVSWPL